MITLSLPMPPSVNRLWRIAYDRHGGKRRMIKSERYCTWQQSAHGYYLQQGIHRQPKIEGHFRACIVLDETKRGRSDVDNRAKAVMDALQAFGVISNDKYCDGLTVEWGAAPLGCLVTLTPNEVQS